MIDTIVLTFDENQYHVTEPDKFEPSLRLLQTKTRGFGGRAYMTFKNNPTKEDYDKGNYRPRMTVTARFKNGIPQNMLKVEFSAPKMLYNNNFDELTEQDLSKLVLKIGKSLAQAGVVILENNLLNANVSAIHYSKNIILQDGSLASMYMKEIRKCNVTLRLDSNSTDYRNEGSTIKFRANSFEIVFYDKLKDLAQSKISCKRTEEKNDNLFQMGLFDEIQTVRSISKKPLEVLRFEVRLNTRKKINQILEKLEIKSESLTLKSLFNGQVSQRVLTHFLNELKLSYPKVLICTRKAHYTLFLELLALNPKAGVKEILAFIGMSVLAEENGMRDIGRSVGNKRIRALNRLKTSFNQLKINSEKVSVLDTLFLQLHEFRSVKLEDFRDKLINVSDK